LERSAIDDLWRITLSQIPSTLGQLAYLASLRHPNTGVYHHAGLEKRCGEPLADEAIRLSHDRVFRHWLTLPITEQRDDCELYWSGLLENRHVVLAAWISGQPYANWAPSSASPAERKNFDLHMSILLEWLKTLSVDA
jgi:hypothetical protein